MSAVRRLEPRAPARAPPALAGKPVLARVYEPWFDALLDAAPRGARVLEVGAGPGFLEAARRRRPDLRWIASDLLPAPWNDVAADAGRLPFSGAPSRRGRGPRRAAPPARLPPTSSPRRRACCGREGGSRSSSPGSRPSRTRSTAGCTRRAAACRSIPGSRSRRGGKDSFDGDGAVTWRMVRDTSARSAGASSASGRRASPPQRLCLPVDPGLSPGLAAAAGAGSAADRASTRDAALARLPRCARSSWDRR